MYRMNNGGCTPHDRLDPRFLDRLRAERAEHHYCNDTHIAEAADEPCEFNYTLAMVYSPNQAWQNLYSVEEGLCEGTIFRELNKPFYGPRCNGGSYE